VLFISFLFILSHNQSYETAWNVQDEELLETENLQSRLKIAIGVRVGEKKSTAADL